MDIIYVSDMYLSLSLSLFHSFNFIISLDGGAIHFMPSPHVYI